MTVPIPASIRAELDQTPAWWDREFAALARKQTPRDAAFHAGHDIDEPLRSWDGTILAREWCSTCHVPIERPPDG